MLTKKILEKIPEKLQKVIGTVLTISFMAFIASIVSILLFFLIVIIFELEPANNSILPIIALIFVAILMLSVVLLLPFAVFSITLLIIDFKKNNDLKPVIKKFLLGYVGFVALLLVLRTIFRPNMPFLEVLTSSILPALAVPYKDILKWFKGEVDSNNEDNEISIEEVKDIIETEINDKISD